MTILSTLTTLTNEYLSNVGSYIPFIIISGIIITIYTIYLKEKMYEVGRITAFLASGAMVTYETDTIKVRVSDTYTETTIGSIANSIYNELVKMGFKSQIKTIQIHQ